jgi:serine protease Do
VGISTAIYANGAGGSLGIGFAVPINLARALADRWIEGKATCFLGIVSAEVDPVMARYFGLPSPGGVFVQSVHEGSPAESGGIRAKDIILSLDRAAVRSVDHLKVLVARNDGLGAVPVEVLRDHQRQVLEVSLTPKADTPRPSRAPADRHERKRGGSGSLGITVCPLDAKVAEQFGLPAESRGIVVLGVAPGSQAARKRLQPGDLIVEVDGRTVRDMEEFRSAMTGSRSDVMMRVLRAGEALGYVFFQR